MSELPERFRVNTEEVAAKVIDGEAIIINLTTGVYYSMDGVGGRVWSLLESHHGLDAVAEAIRAEYEVDPETCRADVLGLAAQLFEEGLMLASEEEPSGSTAGVDVDAKVGYKAPELSIYRDMGDLLALDPPVPGLEPIPWEDPGE